MELTLHSIPRVTCTAIQRQRSCCEKYCSPLGSLASVKQHLGKSKIKKMAKYKLNSHMLHLMSAAFFLM